MDNNKANGAGAKAGGDTVTGGIGEDKGAGDAAEVSDGEANAEVLNRARNGGSAGNDDITTYDGKDTLSGGVLADGLTGAIAEVTHSARDVGSTAGNDIIRRDHGHEAVAGDALASGPTAPRSDAHQSELQS